MNDNIQFPINQAEKAKQDKKEFLLPLAVYRDIVSYLKDSRARLQFLHSQKKLDDLDNCRVHDSIVLDGGRGTGKSSVLVNLATYLEQYPDKDLKKDQLLILKPVDPTLIDKQEDLLLNIIVAAIIRDEQVQKALNQQQNNYTEWFYQKLEELGQALEGVHTTEQKFGLDRLCSYLGNHGLTKRVHELFAATVALTGTEFIVLPIDDVDTSLEFAFENMEVVRKYLASPYVVPIISGDLTLYNDVTWKAFYHRLTKGNKTYDLPDEKLKAQELSQEYFRKILPYPRRIKMPRVEQYFNDSILLTDEHHTPLLSTRQFTGWVNALVKGRSNGNAGTVLRNRIRSVRVMAQLINHCKHLLLHTELAQGMPLRCMAKDLYEFDLRKQIISGAIDKQTVLNWIDLLGDFYKFELKHHNLRLSLDATLYLHRPNIEPGSGRVKLLDHLFFRPQDRFIYGDNDFHWSIETHWQTELKGLYPKQALEHLPVRLPLAHAVPDIGQPVPQIRRAISQLPDMLAGGDMSPEASEAVCRRIAFIGELMTMKSYYNELKQCELAFGGRMFELMVSSIFLEIQGKNISHIIAGTPVYSVQNLSSGRDLDTANDVISGEFAEANQSFFADPATITGSCEQLAADIRDWRNKYNINKLYVDSWFIYCVQKKFFEDLYAYNSQNQASRELGGLHKDDFSRVHHLMSFTYRCALTLIAACGLFEKGPLFHIETPASEKTTVLDVSRGLQHTDVFNFNIRPLLGQPASITDALYNHPLLAQLRTLLGALDSCTAATPAPARPTDQFAALVLKELALENFIGVEQHESTLKALPGIFARLLVAQPGALHELVKVFSLQPPAQINRRSSKDKQLAWLLHWLRQNKPELAELLMALLQKVSAGPAA